MRRHVVLRISHRSSSSSSSSTGSILRDSLANKTGLSYALDGTMRAGAHDLRVFGAGTLRALATRRALYQFLQGHRVFYEALEQELDLAAYGSPSANVWCKFRDVLKRAPRLRHDVVVLAGKLGIEANQALVAPPSMAAAAYASRIKEAGLVEANGGPPLLLGHFYTRYFADLFGGSMLGWPTKLALALEEQPHFYVHTSQELAQNRKAYIEAVYTALNEAGHSLSYSQEQKVVNEAMVAFRLNADLYKEGVGGAGFGMYAFAALGGVRVVAGHVADRLRGGDRDVVGRVISKR